jgi:hypothetical protein
MANEESSNFFEKKKDHIGVSRCAAIFAHVKQYIKDM